jgi:enamine deaminase RidA (YjgF/YER057c/UK114 family)
MTGRLRLHASVAARRCRITRAAIGSDGGRQDGRDVHADDFEAECPLLFNNIAEVVSRAGGSLDDFFMITVYLTDIDDHATFAKF